MGCVNRKSGVAWRLWLQRFGYDLVWNVPQTGTAWNVDDNLLAVVLALLVTLD